jgi:hypothetical protein
LNESESTNDGYVINANHSPIVWDAIYHLSNTNGEMKNKTELRQRQKVAAPLSDTDIEERVWL